MLLSIYTYISSYSLGHCLPMPTVQEEEGKWGKRRLQNQIYKISGFTEWETWDDDFLFISPSLWVRIFAYNAWIYIIFFAQSASSSSLEMFFFRYFFPF